MDRPIVVIESNKDSRTVFEIMFRQGHVQNPIVMLESGQEAMDYLSAANNDTPILILLDMQLTDIKALNVLHFIRATAQIAGCRVMVLRDEELVPGLDAPEMQPVTIVRKYDNAMNLERFFRAGMDLHIGFVLTEQEDKA